MAYFGVTRVDMYVLYLTLHFFLFKPDHSIHQSGL